MSELDILGLIATGFSTSSFIPQIWRSWRTRDVSGISLPTYVILTIALTLWLLYGILKSDAPLVIANAIMIMLSVAIAAMKIAFEKR
ncbi:MAG: SemiSWEET transporter [Methylobacter sp.]|jgi:MtN3 and saliva related transmembrane protein